MPIASHTTYGLIADHGRYGLDDMASQNYSEMTIRSMLESVKEQKSMIEGSLDAFYVKTQPFLPVIGRSLIVLTFLEDALRVISEWSIHVTYLGSHGGIPVAFAHTFLFINVIGMVVGSTLIIIRKHSHYAAISLTTEVLLQTLQYRLLFDVNTLLRNLSILGGLLMIVSETWIREERSSAGVPRMTEDVDRKMYFQLSGRVLLVFQLITLLCSGELTILKGAVGVLGIVACVMVALGFKARSAGIVLVVILSAYNLHWHSFWMFDADHPLKAFAQYNFFQVLCIIGGFLLLVEGGPGKYSIESKKKM